MKGQSEFYGWVAERLKAPVLKTGKGATPSWVQIPPHPPLSYTFQSNIFSQRDTVGPLNVNALHPIEIFLYSGQIKKTYILRHI